MTTTAILLWTFSNVGVTIIRFRALISNQTPSTAGFFEHFLVKEFLKNLEFVEFYLSIEGPVIKLPAKDPV
jgi:hypothetical protein